MTFSNAFSSELLDRRDHEYRRFTPVEYQLNIDRIRHRIDLPGRGPDPKRRLLITGGVHGNESVGAVAALSLIEEIVHAIGTRSIFRENRARRALRRIRATPENLPKEFPGSD